MSAKAARVLLLLARLAAPATALAQLRGPQVAIAAGATFPSGDFYSSRGFKTGWQGVALVAFRIGRSPVGFRLDGSYTANTSSDAINGVPSDSKVELLGGDADLTVTLSSPTRVKVYLLGGVGRYKVTYSVTQRGFTTSLPGSGEWAYNVGGGLTLGALFFELRYVHVDGFGNGYSWILVPVMVGLRLGGW